MESVVTKFYDLSPFSFCLSVASNSWITWILISFFDLRNVTLCELSLCLNWPPSASAPPHLFIFFFSALKYSVHTLFSIRNYSHLVPLTSSLCQWPQTPPWALLFWHFWAACYRFQCGRSTASSKSPPPKPSSKLPLDLPPFHDWLLVSLLFHVSYSLWQSSYLFYSPQTFHGPGSLFLPYHQKALTHKYKQIEVILWKPFVFSLPKLQTYCMCAHLLSLPSYNN